MGWITNTFGVAGATIGSVGFVLGPVGIATAIIGGAVGAGVGYIVENLTVSCNIAVHAFIDESKCSVLNL